MIIYTVRRKISKETTTLWCDPDIRFTENVVALLLDNAEI